MRLRVTLAPLAAVAALTLSTALAEAPARGEIVGFASVFSMPATVTVVDP
ncbi:MAG: hypothetical protein ACYC1C_00955 [Chloroflexota bacterium]